MHKAIINAFMVLVGGVLAVSVYAESWELTNGDRLSGELVSETETSLTVATDAMGTVAIDKSYVVFPQKVPTQPEVRSVGDAAPVYSGEIALGGDYTEGNTQSREWNAAAAFKRKTASDEFDLKGWGYYSENNDVIDGEKIGGFGRYAFSFFKKAYNFYKVEAEHDQIANIEYRIIPSTGLGYWFADTEKFKLRTEIAIGVTYTHFENLTDEEASLDLIPTSFIEYRLDSGFIVANDFAIYPSLTDTGEYRFKSDTRLEHPVTDHLSLRLSAVSEFNSNPGDDTEKNDLRLISAAVYAL